MNAKIASVLVAASVMLTGCGFIQTDVSSNSSSAVSSAAKTFISKTSLKKAKQVAAEKEAAEKAAADKVAADKAAAEARAAEAAALEAKRIADEKARVEAEIAAYEAAVKAERDAAIIAAQQAKDAQIRAEAADKAKKDADAAAAAAAKASTSALPGESGYQWMDRMQRLYGVYAYPGTQFFVAPSNPCVRIQPTASACTEQLVDSVTKKPLNEGIKLHMNESAIGNVYILFHEIAHTQGIMDECQADIYSRNVTGIPGGYYCQ